MSKFVLTGHVIARLYGADGILKFTTQNHNLIVDVGVEFIMDVALSGGTQDVGPAFWVGLKDTGTPLVGWTMASGPTELTNYTGNRQAWTEAGLASKVITNAASTADFAITSADDIYGAFLNTDETGTAGTLIGAADFGAPVTVANLDTLSVTYQITGSSS